MAPNVSLLVVEDDSVFRERLSHAFRDRGYRVTAASSVEEAKAVTQAECFTHAILDLRLHDGSGSTLVPLLRAQFPGIRCVILTGYGSIATAVQAVKDGAVGYLAKPVDADDIERAFMGAGLSEPDEIANQGKVPSLARVEWEHIHRVLQDCAGNVSQAARVLGIHRRSLQRKLAKRPTQR